MSVGMEDSHSQKHRQILQGLGLQDRALLITLWLWTEGTNVMPISDLFIPVLTQHQPTRSACKFRTSTGALQQPRLSWASVHASQANQSDCQCATVINMPHHNLTGYHIKLVVSAKSNSQQADSGYRTCNVPRLERRGEDRAACTGWSDTNGHCRDIK